MTQNDYTCNFKSTCLSLHQQHTVSVVLNFVDVSPVVDKVRYVNSSVLLI